MGRLTITQPSSRDFIPGPGKTNCAAAAEHLEPEIPHGDARAAAAAAAALHEKAQTRDELGGRQRAPARGAVTASLDHALSARQTPDHNAEKAEYARAEREAQQP